MDKTKQIEKFIRESVKQKRKNVDIAELQNLFDQMTTQEIQMFWHSYSSNIAYSIGHT